LPHTFLPFFRTGSFRVFPLNVLRFGYNLDRFFGDFVVAAPDQGQTGFFFLLLRGKRAYFFSQKPAAFLRGLLRS
jgi:hypothetical protein